MNEKTVMRKTTLPGVDAELPVEIVTEDGTGLIKHDVLEDFITKLTRINAEYKLVASNPSPFLAVVECRMTDKETGYSVTKVGETNASNLKGEISKNFPFTMAYQRAYNRAGIAILGLSEGGKIYSDVEISKKELQKSEKPRNVLSATATPKADSTPETKTDPATETDADIMREDIPEEKMPAPAQEVKSVVKEESKPQAKAKAKAEPEPEPEPQPEPQPEPEPEPESEPEPQPDVAGLTDDTEILIGCCIGQKYGAVKNSKKFTAYVQWCKKQEETPKMRTPEQQAQFEILRNLPD